MKRLIVLLALLTAAPIASAQTSIGFPPQGVRIIDALAAQHADLAWGDDTQRRALVKMIGEQMAFELGPRWGNKKRTGLGDEYRSKDSIGYFEDDGTCSVWDWQDGGTRTRKISEGDAPTYSHLPAKEATCMAVEPRNHLGAAPSPGPVAPTPSTPAPQPIPTLDLSGLSYRLDSLTAQIERMYADYVARDNRISSQIAGLDQKVEAVKEKEGPIEATVSNRYFQIIAAALAAAITTQQVTK